MTLSHLADSGGGQSTPPTTATPSPPSALPSTVSSLWSTVASTLVSTTTDTVKPTTPSPTSASSLFSSVLSTAASSEFVSSSTLTFASSTRPTSSSIATTSDATDASAEDGMISHIITQTLNAIEFNCTDIPFDTSLFFNLTENSEHLLNSLQLGGSSSPNSSSTKGTAISSSSSSTSLYCPSAWDGLSCWYRTLSGHEAVIPCFSNFNGVNYDITQNASRLCLPNGTWAERADYDRCKPLKIEQIPIEHLYTPTIYYIGYGLSLCALTVALWIFLYFKDLRCVRNTIHTNLMITYLLIAVCWITTDRLHSNPSPLSRKASCMIVILLTYLMGTNFFWMFVEGLYLYILVVKTFSIEFVKIQNYAFIGWGLPAVVVLVWSLTKLYFSRYESMLAECPWQAQDEFDYIYKVPILLVLLINIFFLGKIMWVLIIKLRAATSAESKQYRKAAKALLVLIPLLGVGYILVLVTPTHSTAKLVFQYLQAILVSTQGFTVAVLYCFCNGEVRNSVRNHFQRFRLRRTLRYGGDYPAKHSTYYRTTAHYFPHNHQQKNSSGGNGTTANNKKQRSSYAFQSLKSNRADSADPVSNIDGTNGSGSRVGINNGRFSNSSDSATSRLYRNSSRGGKCRDSCVSFTTTSSYVVLAPSTNSNSTGICGGNGCSTPTRVAMMNSTNGYHSVPSTPDNEKLSNQLEIELQPL